MHQTDMHILLHLIYIHIQNHQQHGIQRHHLLLHHSHEKQQSLYLLIYKHNLLGYFHLLNKSPYNQNIYQAIQEWPQILYLLL